jgi:hypothetical protein
MTDTNIKDIVIGALNADIQSDSENQLLAYIGESLIDVCAKDENVAERLNAAINDGKTLNGAGEAIIEAARKLKVKSNNVALTNQRCMDIALEYFGLTDCNIIATELDESCAELSIRPEPPRKPRRSLSLNIDELLA